MITEKDALHILIEHALSDCQGVGTGIRSLPSPEKRWRVAQAIEKVWKQAYGQPMTKQDKSGLRFGFLFLKPEGKR